MQTQRYEGLDAVIHGWHTSQVVAKGSICKLRAVVKIGVKVILQL